MAAQALPPRIVVEMPDGDVTLGEDTGKIAELERDVQAKQAKMSLPELGGATVGSHRWASMVAGQYALSLRDLQAWRVKYFACPLGIDIGSMIWPILCVCFADSFGSWGINFTITKWQVFALCGGSIFTNVMLLAFAVRQQWHVQHMLTWLHLAVYLLMWGARFDINLWAVTRPVAILYSFWVLSVHWELETVRQQQRLPGCSWRNTVQALMLGKSVAENRRLYAESIASALDDEAAQPEAGTASAVGNSVDAADRAGSLPIPAQHNTTDTLDSAESTASGPPLAQRSSAELECAPADAIASLRLNRSASMQHKDLRELVAAEPLQHSHSMS